MGLAEELIAIKMRLQGAASYQRQMQRSTATTTEYGAAAERAGAQAKAGAVGIDAMAASSTKGVGSMARMKKAGEGLKSTGSRLTSAWTVPIALIGGVGVKMALDFSDSMSQISTQAGASQREVKSMTNAVLEYARSGKSAHGPNELSAGLFRIESAGFRGKRALEAMTKSEQLASVGHADFEKTSTAVSAAMATQIKGTQNLDETVGLMNSTVGIGNMRFEDLLSAMSTGLLDRAANFGLSLKEVGAALGTMTTVGQPAAASATRMAMAFNMMAAPTEKAKKAMKGIGLEATDMAMSLRKRGLIPTLELLKTHLDKAFGTSDKGLSEQANAISEMFGGGRTSGGLITLMRHVDLLKKKQGELVGVQEKFKMALEHTDAQPITKLKQGWAQLQVVLIELGATLIPVVTGIMKFVVGAAHWFQQLPGPVKTTLIVLAGVLAILGPLLSMIGMMTLGVEGLIAVMAVLDIELAGLPILIGTAAALVVGLTGFLSGGATQTNRLASASKNLSKYMEGQASAGRNLVQTEHRLTKAKRTHRKAADALKTAQGRVNDIIAKYGPHSKPAVHAEQMLAQKRWSLVRATHALKNAERQHGIALQMTKQLSRSAVLEGRHEINLLKFKKTQFDELFVREKNAGASNQRLNQISEWGSHVNDRLQKAHKKLNEVILEASQKVGPKYAKFLSNARRETIEFGSAAAEAKSKFEQIIGLGERLNNLNRIEHGLPANPPGSGLGNSPGGGGRHGGKGGGRHRPTSASGAAGGGSVRLMRYRGGPTPMQAEAGRQNGAKHGKGGTPIEVPVKLYVGRRQFGEAMAMAMFDDEANS